MDGRLILSKFSKDSYRLWERSSGSLLENFDENSNFAFPLPLQLLFKQNLIKKSDFVESTILSMHEKMMVCEKMFIINPISLSEENAQVFLEKNAIFQQGQPDKNRKIGVTKKPTKFKKTCICQMI